MIPRARSPFANLHGFSISTCRSLCCCCDTASSPSRMHQELFWFASCHRHEYLVNTKLSISYVFWMNQAGPGMSSLESDENFDQSLLLRNTEKPEKNGDVGGNSNPHLQSYDFSLDDTFDSENPGYSCSLSFPSVLSEPPDIRNFFSSYIYESPDLDTGEDFSNIASGESDTDKAPVMSEDDDKTNEKGFGAHRTSADIDSSFRKELSYETDTKLQDHSPAKDKHNLLVTDIGENKSLKHKLVGNHELAPIENDGKSGSSDGNSLRKHEEEFFAKGDHNVLKTSIKYETSNGQGSLERRRLTMEVGHIADSRESIGASSKKLLPSSNSEQEKIKNTTTNGFVSTKKNYPRSENSGNFLKRSQENRIEHKRKTTLDHPPVEEMHTRVVERRPLVEKTNFLNKMAIPELTGKWRCPQKSKPDLGPPTKQLRLERWIHRL